MTELRCPTCGKTVVLASPLPPAFPFCSPRCRTRDLADWAEGKHVIAGRHGAPLTPDADGEH